VVKWGKDYNSGRHSILTDSTMLDFVTRNYRQKPTLSTETLLLNAVDAQLKADWLLQRLSTVPRYVTLQLAGLEYIQLRLFDIGTLDLGVNIDRLYFGLWKVSVIGVAPDYDLGINTVRMALIEEL